VRIKKEARRWWLGDWREKKKVWELRRRILVEDRLGDGCG
jgi:hypothetical protein